MSSKKKRRTGKNAATSSAAAATTPASTSSTSSSTIGVAAVVAVPPESILMRLPLDIVAVRIFDYLDIKILLQLWSVSSHIRRLTYHHMRQRDTIIITGDPNHSEHDHGINWRCINESKRQLLSTLLIAARELRHLDVPDNEPMLPILLTTINNCNESLRHINVDTTVCSETTLICSAMMCPSLRSLNFIGGITSTPMNGKALLQLVQTCPLQDLFFTLSSNGITEQQSNEIIAAGTHVYAQLIAIISFTD
jgi:hypothetical protein